MPNFAAIDALQQAILNFFDNLIENPVETVLEIPTSTVLSPVWWAEGGWFNIIVWGFALALLLLAIAILRNPDRRTQIINKIRRD